MIGLHVAYNLKLEIKRVTFTLAKLPWYIENSYNVSFPEGLTENSTDEEIANKVTKAYSEEEYREFAKPLEDAWNKYYSVIETIYALEGFSPIKDSYTVVLTRYGTGGSYFPEESTIIINCSRTRKINPIGTVMHEMVHMGIDHLIQEYDISHWKKERLVDLLCNKYFPEVTFMQEIPEDVTMVDVIFSKKYPNIKAVIMEMADIDKLQR